MSKLILVPTPLNDELPLEPLARDLLEEDCLKEEVVLLVEEHKVARRRWLCWNLPREAIEKFILFNEHTSEKLEKEIINKLKAGQRAYLLSDAGLPAFCDPGQTLVDLCHTHHITVTSTPFPNSISLALALSGFSHARFVFSGFVPLKSPDREEWMRRELKRPETMIWMETPYRLMKLLEELATLETKRKIFLAMDLGLKEEKLLRGEIKGVLKKLQPDEKREFVLVLSPLN